MNRASANCKSSAIQAHDLREAGIDIVALCTDLDASRAPGRHQLPRVVLKRISFPFRAGLATEELLDRLQVFHDWTFFRTSALPLPCSFLLDKNGDLRAAYKGRLDLETLFADCLVDPNDRAFPFPGRWQLAERSHRPLWIASRLVALGDPQLAMEYVRKQEVVAQRDPDFGPARLRLGMFMLAEDHFEDAEIELRAALRAMPRSADTHVGLATVLYLQGRVDEATDLFFRAAEIDPRNAPRWQQEVSAEFSRRGLPSPFTRKPENP